MKKWLSALLIAVAVSMLSGCIILDPDYWLYGDNTLYIYNDSSSSVYVDYVEDEYYNRYDPVSHHISAGSRTKVRHLPDGEYFAVIKVGSYDYEATGWFKVNRDKELHIKKYKDWDYVCNH